MKHTPGTWNYVYGSDREFVAKTTSNAKPYRDDKEERANARLIASSPDLLEACKMILELLDYMTTTQYSAGYDKPARIILNQVIAKAEGRD